MDVTLGPWTAENSIDPKQRQSLLDAMGDEAWKTATKAGFTPKKVERGKPAAEGFSISGRLTAVTKKPGSTQVAAKYSVLVDGFLSNVVMLDGKGAAEGSARAEDALRAITESRVNTLLQAIKAGRVARQG